MADVRVEQSDKEAWEALYASTDVYRDNEAAALQILARHRQAAEKAQQERDASYIEGKGGVIPGATVFVSVITGDRMPCMSGDARDKLPPHKRRQFDDATRDLATAIRSQGHE